MVKITRFNLMIGLFLFKNLDIILQNNSKKLSKKVKN